MRHDFIAFSRHRKLIRNVLLGSSFLLSLLAVPHVANATPAQLEGELEVMHWDNSDKTSTFKHFLRGNDGKRYELKFKKHAPRHITGTKIRVKGEQSGNVLALDSSTSTSSYQVLAMATPNTFGAQKTAVLMVNFTNNATQPYTATQATSTVFGSASDYIKENSSQQTWLTGNVYGWLTLPIAQTCSYYSIASAAKTAASASGVDLSQYTRFVYVFPYNSSCGWSGMGTVGGIPSDTWINGYLDRTGVTHELGHNFGLWHSHSLDCGSTSVGSTCSRSEYGNPFDTMGSSKAHYNAFQKERLGWLNYGVSPSITTVTTSGTFTLEPYAASSNGVKALKVLKSTDSTTGVKTWYYIEFRQAIGFDTYLSGYPAVMNGVLVHTATDGDGNSSDLLDMTPTTATSGDFVDSPLAAGKSYTDSTTGMTITVLSVSSTGASVSVSLSGQPTPTPTCTHANPGIALSGQSASVAPGTAVTYTVSVTNADSSACSSSQFNLSSVVPAGWTVSPASATLTLAPGSSGSTSVVVTSPTTATAGFYTVSGKAVNSSATSFTASTSTTYTVATSSTTTTTNKPPVAVNDSAATTAGTAVKISVLANDSDPEGKALTVKSAGVPARGTAVVNADGTVTYKPNGKFKGSDSFTYTISDGVNTASATASVQVTR